MSPKQHSLQDLREDYEGAISVLSKYQTKMLGVIDAQAAQKLVKKFEEKALGALVNVSESAVNVADRKQSKKQAIISLSSREKEDFAHDYGNAVAKRIDSKHEGFLSMEEMLDEVIRLEAEMLSRGSIRIPVRIFSPKPSGSVVTGNGGGMEGVKVVPKYESLVRMLSRRNIDISALMVGVETLEKSQMRKVPYRVVWMANPLRTVCISDEVGEKTYVYHGFVDISSLAVHEKGEPIHGVPAVGVTYSDTYETSLERAVFDEDVSFMKDGQIIPAITSPSNSEFVPDAEILIYQSILLTHEEDFKKIGIIQKEGVWYFGNAKGSQDWPKIHGKSLRVFPSCTFNKVHHIGNKQGMVLGLGDLKKVFEATGLRVASDQQELEKRQKGDNEIFIPQWRKCLEDSRGELEKIGIIQEDNVWYFTDSKGNGNWPKIHGKGLMTFPNCAFNRSLGILNNNGIISNPEELKIMFRGIGCIVANDEQNVARWRKMFQGAEKKFSEVEIVQEDGIWYFGDAKGCDSWPRIGGKTLMSFPSKAFNKNHGIGDSNGIIANREELKKMFHTIGFIVANEDQEMARWGKILQSAENELREAGVIQYEGIWYFANTKGNRTWPTIKGKRLMSFPNTLFNRAHNIGTSTGTINNSDELKKMFGILGLMVASDEQEMRKQYELNNTTLIPRWRKELEDAQQTLGDVGIIQEKGVWYFGDAKGYDFWPRISSRRLASFPNCTFNKSKNIGDSDGTMRSVEDLKKVFQILGFTVASDEQEKNRWKQILQSAQLGDIGISKEEDIWYFGSAQGSDKWPIIYNRNLKSFPNAGFNKAHSIGDSLGKIGNLTELKKMFRTLGFSVATEEQELERKKKQ